MRAPLILGIDPGAKGALAFLSSYVSVHDMPDATGAALGALIRDIITEAGMPTVAWVEQVHSMPGQGVASTFKFGVNYGVILGVLGAWDIPVRHVTPAKWKGALGLSKDKAASRQRAVELWPASSHLFARVKDDGRAESALIAWYGRGQS